MSIIMTYKVEFYCKACGEEFEADWLFGDNVQCPHCGATFETDYETNFDDDILGPWLTRHLPDAPPE